MTTTKQTEKIEYDRNDDKVVLDQIKKSETLAEAMRKSAEIIREKHGKNTTPEKLNSRYYSYIKPHYIEGGESIDEDYRKPVMDRVTSSNGPSKVDVLTALADTLDFSETVEFMRRLLNKADVKTRNQNQDAII